MLHFSLSLPFHSSLSLLKRTFVVCDADGQFVGLNIFNMAEQTVVNFDVLAIPATAVSRQHVALHVGDKQLDFDLLRVDDPSIIVRNGRRLG